MKIEESTGKPVLGLADASLNEIAISQYHVTLVKVLSQLKVRIFYTFELSLGCSKMGGREIFLFFHSCACSPALAFPVSRQIPVSGQWHLSSFCLSPRWAVLSSFLGLRLPAAHDLPPAQQVLRGVLTQMFPLGNWVFPGLFLWSLAYSLPSRFKIIHVLLVPLVTGLPCSSWLRRLGCFCSGKYWAEARSLL